jgi:hypothetical protein
VSPPDWILCLQPLTWHALISFLIALKICWAICPVYWRLAWPRSIHTAVGSYFRCAGKSCLMKISFEHTVMVSFWLVWMESYGEYFREYSHILLIIQRSTTILFLGSNCLIIHILQWPISVLYGWTDLHNILYNTGQRTMGPW